MRVLGTVPATDADRRTYADTRAGRELGLVARGWVEREVRETHFGEERIRREVVLILGRPAS